MDRPPTVIYRSSEQHALRQLTEFLCDHGIDARLAVSNPQMPKYFRGVEQFYEILARNYDADEVRTLITQWEQQPTDAQQPLAPGVGHYCYHCGEALSAPRETCSSCGGDLS